MWERRILRNIYSSLRIEFEDWRIRTNYELENMVNGANIIRFIKAQRMKWLGRVVRLDVKRMVKSVTN